MHAWDSDIAHTLHELERPKLFCDSSISPMHTHTYLCADTCRTHDREFGVGLLLNFDGFDGREPSGDDGLILCRITDGVYENLFLTANTRGNRC